MTFYLIGASEEDDYSGCIRLFLNEYSSLDEAIDMAKHILTNRSAYHPDYNSAKVYEINSIPVSISKKPVVEVVKE